MILLYNRFLEFYNKGDFLNAEKTLLSAFELKEPLTEVQLKSIYNNLGAIYFYLGRYREALDFYTKAESLDVKNKITLGGVYINKAIIYEIQKLYNLSLEYFEKGIRIYLENNDNESRNSNLISKAYHNFGIMYLYKPCPHIKGFVTILRENLFSPFCLLNWINCI